MRGADCVDRCGPGVASLCPLGLAFPLPAESLVRMFVRNDTSRQNTTPLVPCPSRGNPLPIFPIPLVTAPNMQCACEPEFRRL